MAKVIALSGDVGWEITAKKIREELKSAKGKDVEFHVNSPGGFVFDAFEIYNVIRAYKGKTEARITGFAASAASYIVLAADKVTAHENAVYMIHNAWNLAIGDHNDMRKVANTLEGLSNILAKAYAKKTGKDVDAIKSFMDNDTYFFGDEMQVEGFVDEMIEAADDGDDKDSAIMKARAAMDTCLKRMRESEAANQDLEKAVAYMDGLSALMSDTKKNKKKTAADPDDDGGCGGGT
jgi:ATP-dependent protease ClpP protease subunit